MQFIVLFREFSHFFLYISVGSLIAEIQYLYDVCTKTWLLLLQIEYYGLILEFQITTFLTLFDSTSLTGLSQLFRHTTTLKFFQRMEMCAER